MFFTGVYLLIVVCDGHSLLSGGVYCLALFLLFPSLMPFETPHTAARSLRSSTSVIGIKLQAFQVESWGSGWVILGFPFSSRRKLEISLLLSRRHGVISMTFPHCDQFSSGLFLF